VELVITQPDRPRGRSGTPVAPPVKRAAEQWGLRIQQPNDRDELWGNLSQLPFEVGLVVAYGKILEPRVLELPPFGYLNVHFSLLPRWRGAAPVERAILAGDEKTGVSLMLLDQGVDTGPVVAVVETPITDDETGGSLTGRLSYLGGMIVNDAVPEYLAAQLEPAPQIDAGVTNAPLLDPNEAQIDGSWGADAVDRAVRAFHPRPGAWVMIDGVRHKLLEVEHTDAFVEPGAFEEVDGEPAAGFVEGSLLLVTLQPAGRPVQSGSDWLNGRRGAGGKIDPA
jgi:methionyl-tRNA formyltransferase